MEHLLLKLGAPRHASSKLSFLLCVFLSPRMLRFQQTETLVFFYKGGGSLFFCPKLRRKVGWSGSSRGQYNFGILSRTTDWFASGNDWFALGNGRGKSGSNLGTIRERYCLGSRMRFWLGNVGGCPARGIPTLLTPYRPKNTTSRDPYPLRAGSPLPAGTPHSFGKGKGQGVPARRGGGFRLVAFSDCGRFGRGTTTSRDPLPLLIRNVGFPEICAH